MKTKFALAAAALAAATFLSGAASAKTFVYCSEGSPEGFDPGMYTAGTTFDASAHPIYSRLMEFKPGTTEAEAGLAESYEVNAEGTEYTFKLRPGVKFHTTEFFTPSRDFNADDVIFSLERQLKADHPWNQYVAGTSWEYAAGMGFPELIKSIEKVDDLTVKISLNKPEAPFLANLAMPFASILSKEYADKLEAEGKKEQLNQMPIGTGPFSFVGYQQDAVIRYKKNADYWGGAPKIDDLVFAITTDAAVRYQKLKAGECHLMPFPNAADVATMKADPALTVMEQEGLNVAYLAYNTTQAPFDKPEVRKALNKAINKEAIVDAVFQGMATPAKNPIPPTMWSYNDAVEDDKYDPEAAKKDARSSRRQGSQDEDLGHARRASLHAERPSCGRTDAGDLAKIGVEVEIVSYEWAEYLKLSKAKDRDGAVMLGWTGDNGDPDNFLDTLLGCEAVGGNNRAQWCNKEFDDARERRPRKPPTRPSVPSSMKRPRSSSSAKHRGTRLTTRWLVVPMSKKVSGFVQSPLGDFVFEGVDIAE